jgi:hypothetical protein
MRTDEMIAYRYLRDAKIGTVEQIVNDPPDFLVDGKIAVEVRRLNQYFTSGSKREELETLAVSLRRRVDDLLNSLGPPSAGVSWFVFFRFKRPRVSWRTLEGPLRERLEAFRSGTAVDTAISVTDNFFLWLHPASGVQRYHFVMGGDLDRNAGGFPLAQLLTNLEICIEEKTQKIARVRSRYPEWWLVLIDHIARDLVDDHYRDAIRQWLRQQDRHDWDKIILVNPDDARSTFEG